MPMKRDASFVIREKATKKVILETFDPRVAAAINKAKYEVVPILDYLQELNQNMKPKKNPAPAYASRVSRLRALADKIDAQKKSLWNRIGGGKVKRLTSAMYYSKKWEPWRKLNEKTVRISDMILREAGKENKRRAYKSNPSRSRYFVRAHTRNGMRFVHKDKRGIYLSSDRKDVTLFASKASAQALADHLNKDAYAISANVEKVYW